MYPDQIVEYASNINISSTIGRGGITKVGKSAISFLAQYGVVVPPDIKITEFLHMIKNKISERPVCMCGNRIDKFQIINKIIVYQKYCSFKCYKSDESVNKKISDIKSNLYSSEIWKQETEQKKMDTNLRKLGVPHAMQNHDSHEKQQKACFKNGKTVDGMFLIGYEPEAYEFLKRQFDCIEQAKSYLKKKELILKWYDDLGKKHTSTPDFFIESENMFVEVKSKYTREKHDYKIMKAKDTCNSLGYNYVVLTVVPRKNKHSIFITESFISTTKIHDAHPDLF